MENTIMGRHWLARAVGVAGIAAAVAISCQEAFATGHWSLEHVLIIGVILITVAAGHLLWDAVKDWKAFSAIGFAILFGLGTGVTLYNSIGRQAAIADKAMLSATSTNNRIARLETDLEDRRTKQKEAEREVSAQTKSRCKQICEDWKTLAREIKGEIKEMETELADLGPAVPVAPKAGRVAQVLAWAGYDEESTKAFLVLIDPFILTLWAELTAIVGLSYGFPSAPRAKRAKTETPKTETVATVPAVETVKETVAETVVEPETVAPVSVVSLDSLRFTRQQAETDILEIVARGETVPAQDVLSDRWHVPKGTVSRWLGAFEERGIIQRNSVGRCKTVSAR